MDNWTAGLREFGTEDGKPRTEDSSDERSELRGRRTLDDWTARRQDDKTYGARGRATEVRAHWKSALRESGTAVG